MGDRLQLQALWRKTGPQDHGYDLEAAKPRVDKIAETIKLEPVVKQGDISPIEKLLTGDWDTAHFCVIPPGRETTYHDFDGASLRLPC